MSDPIYEKCLSHPHETQMHIQFHCKYPDSPNNRRTA